MLEQQNMKSVRARFLEIDSVAFVLRRARYSVAPMGRRGERLKGERLITRRLCSIERIFDLFQECGSKALVALGLITWLTACLVVWLM